MLKTVVTAGRSRIADILYTNVSGKKPTSQLATEYVQSVQNLNGVMKDQINVFVIRCMATNIVIEKLA